MAYFKCASSKLLMTVFALKAPEALEHQEPRDLNFHICGILQDIGMQDSSRHVP